MILKPSFTPPNRVGYNEGMSIKAHPPHLALHVPVLLEQTLQTLAPQVGESYLDLTAGYGGHAAAVLEMTKSPSSAVLVDRDENAMTELKTLKGLNGVTLLHTDFLTAAQALVEEGRQFDVLLVDLGVSSPQLDRAERGFSFKRDGPLDMRMDPSQETTAADIVNRSSEHELLRIITEYGEEHSGFARRIVATMMRNRPITTTKQLADLILNEHRGKWQRTHPATRTFQALRIAINDELHQVEALMPLIPSLLNKNGRAAVISFHSLEDRIVKRYFKDQAMAGYEAELEVLTKKPVDGAISDVHNPRSRSAKLRVAVKK